MYVDPMNNEGFGERALEREIWRVGSLEDFCYAVSQLISDSTYSLQLMKTGVFLAVLSLGSICRTKFRYRTIMVK